MTLYLPRQHRHKENAHGNFECRKLTRWWRAESKHFWWWRLARASQRWSSQTWYNYCASIRQRVHTTWYSRSSKCNDQGAQWHRHLLKYFWCLQPQSRGFVPGIYHSVLHSKLMWSTKTVESHFPFKRFCQNTNTVFPVGTMCVGKHRKQWSCSVCPDMKAAGGGVVKT